MPPADSPHQPDADRIEAEAAAWLAKRDRGFTPREEADFAAWLAADLRRRAAVDELEFAWEALDDLSASETPAKAVAPAPPPFSTTMPAAESKSAISAWWTVLAAAAAIAVAVGLGWWRFGGSDRVAPDRTLHYATAIGRQEKVSLPDGSTLWLNTDTAVAVRFTRALREVRLERGEASFAVARAPDRPFVVASATTEARVLGTVFNLRQRDRGTELVVTEGRVQFSSPTAPGVVVTSGQWARLALGTRAPEVKTLGAAECARRVAWQNGRLEFAEEPLGGVVAEFNRYHRHQLVVRDAATAAVLVGGTFQADNLSGFVRLLESSFGIAAEAEGPDRTVLSLKPR